MPRTCCSDALTFLISIPALCIFSLWGLISWCYEMELQASVLAGEAGH